MNDRIKSRILAVAIGLGLWYACMLSAWQPDPALDAPATGSQK